MIFGNRRVVEEELERIRLANLPPAREETKDEIVLEDEYDALSTDEIEETEDAIGYDASDVDEDVEIYTEPVESVEIGFTAKDILAMIIAVFSIILPYALIMLVVAVLFVMFFFR